MSWFVVVPVFRKLVHMWRENRLFQLFSVHSQKGGEIAIKTWCIRWDREIIQKIFERKVDSDVRRERMVQQNCMKLWLKLRQEIGRREILTSLFMISVRNLNLNDSRYIKQVDGQIWIREVKISLCRESEFRNLLFQKIMQGISKKLKNWEEFVAKKLIKQGKQELKNCLCNKRGTLWPWVN